jgi:cell division protein FtsL
MNESQKTLARYLLGELTEAEQAALEQEYFADPRLFDQVVEAENELVDKYARGQLSSQQQQRFEEHFLAHPKRRERATFAQALTARVDVPNQIAVASSSQLDSWWSRLLASLQGPKLAWGLSFALLLIIAGLVWFGLQTRRLHRELARDEAERARQEAEQRNLQQQIAGERARADQLASELDRLRAEQQAGAQTPTAFGPSAPAFITLMLNITGVRGAESGPPARLNIPAGTQQARIQLNLRDNDYPRYSVMIQSADGKEIFKRDGLRSPGKTRASLSVVVPASRLSKGDYILTLRGITPTGEIEALSKSFFRVSQSRR